MILSLYARGMSTREIQGHLEEIYGVEVSPTLISEVTDWTGPGYRTVPHPHCSWEGDAPPAEWEERVARLG